MSVATSEDLRSRSCREVLADHLRLRRAGELEAEPRGRPTPSLRWVTAAGPSAAVIRRVALRPLRQRSRA